MKIYKNSYFDRFARKNNILDQELVEAVQRIKKGLIDADLGGFVIKQRIARNQQSSARGFRAIILAAQNNAYFYVFGYAKTDRENISTKELSEFKKLAKIMCFLDEQKIKALVKNNALIEVHENDKKI